MKIKTIVEKEDGAYEFQAEISDIQHRFLLEYAIRDLVTRGLIPFADKDKESQIVQVEQTPETVLQ